MSINLNDAIVLNSSSLENAVKGLIKKTDEKQTYGGYNYRCADAQLLNFLMKKKTRQQVLDHCDTLSDKNSGINKAALSLSTEHYSTIKFENAHSLSSKPWHLRKDVVVQCNGVFAYVENGQLVIAWVQNRQDSGLLNESGLFLQASVLQAVFARDDYAGAIIETVDVSYSKADKKRVLRVKRYTAKSLLPEKNLFSAFEPFLEAWDIVYGGKGPASPGKDIHKTT